ncbi:MAG: hydroxypyruvate isomerase, partial [Planctomycetota bacterium]|nr:hydroxypyruvate isomerase [Planctomycetota bacterium]
MESNPPEKTNVNRRHILQGAASAAAAGVVGLAGQASAADSQPGGLTPLKGNIHHSIVHWCFAEHWDVEKACQVARQLGCQSVELVAPEH